MLLYEFGNESPLVTKLITLGSQLKTDVALGKMKADWTLEELLEYFRKYNVIIGKKDLYNMIKQEPMKNYISNIQGDKVTIAGQKSEPSMSGPPPAPEDQKKVVSQMAKKAMKK